MESTISCAQKYDNQIYHRQQSVNTCSYVVELEKNQTSKLFSARRRTRSLPFNISHELPSSLFLLLNSFELKRWQKIKSSLGSNGGSRAFLKRWTVKDSKHTVDIILKRKMDDKNTCKRRYTFYLFSFLYKKYSLVRSSHHR